MSAAKRTTVRRKKVTKKSAKKTTKKVARSTRTATKRVAKTTKKTSKKTTKKVTKKTTKKQAVKRAGNYPKNVAITSVRTARYGGHENTMPTNPKAPGRLLGRSVSLSVIGLSSLPINPDAIAVGVARLGGVAIMAFGLFYSWHLYNDIAAPADLTQSASLITATEEREPSVTVTETGDITDTVTIVVSSDQTEVVILALESDTGYTVIGSADNRTPATWEYSFDSTTVADGEYTVVALLERAGLYEVIRSPESVVIKNTEETILEELVVGTDSATSTPVTEQVSTSTQREAATTTINEVDITPLPTTTMPTLVAPTVDIIAPINSVESLVVGEATPDQTIELLLLRDRQRATTSVQANGWWSLIVTTPQKGDQYELYALATPDLLSGPLDFSVIAGRLTRTPPTGDTQTTSVSDSDPATDMLMWYLITAVATIGIGAVVLLVGHYLHHERRRTRALTTAT